MPRVMLSLRQTSVDVLSTVSATAATFTSGVSSMANYADALEAHSAHYRDTTRAELALATEAFKMIARDRAKSRIAHARMDLMEELKDPKFAAVYNSIKLDDELTENSRNPALSVAAE